LQQNKKKAKKKTKEVFLKKYLIVV